MAQFNSQVKAAIFDIGATLVTGPPVAPNKVIAALIGGANASDVSSIIMTTDLGSAECICKALASKFGGLEEDAVRQITELWNSQATAAQAIEGARETVLALRDQGLRIGLLSDIWNPYYASVERALPDVIQCAEAIVLSCRTGVRKPNPENFARVLAELNLSPEEAVMIGDTYTHDIQPALELGMKAIWVLARPDRELDSLLNILNGNCPAPTVTVPHIADVPKLDLWRGKGK